MGMTNSKRLFANENDLCTIKVKKLIIVRLKFWGGDKDRPDSVYVHNFKHKNAVNFGSK